jgi:Flp pilus assembly protein TadG
MKKNIITVIAVAVLLTMSALSGGNPSISKQNVFGLDAVCAAPLLLPISYTTDLGNITAGNHNVTKDMESSFTLYADGTKTWTISIIKNGEPIASGSSGGYITLNSEWEDGNSNPLVITTGGDGVKTFPQTPTPANCSGTATFKVKVLTASADASVVAGTYTFNFMVSIVVN